MSKTTTYLLIGAAGVALYVFMTRKKPMTEQQKMLAAQNAGF